MLEHYEMNTKQNIQHMSEHAKRQQRLSNECRICLQNTAHRTAIMICIEFFSTGDHDPFLLKKYYNCVCEICKFSTQVNPAIIEMILLHITSWMLDRPVKITGYTATENKELPPHKLSIAQKISFVNQLRYVEQNLIAIVRKTYHNKYLLEIYNDDKLMSENDTLRETVEEVFMIGLTNENVKHRKPFLDSLNNRIEKDIYSRMQFIFHARNWKPLNSIFWIRHALDLLIDSVIVTDPVVIGNNVPGSKLPPIMENNNEILLEENINSYDNETYEKLKDLIENAQEIKLSKTAKEELTKHDAFINGARENYVRDILLPLRYLARESVRISLDLWVALFPCAWVSLTEREKEDLFEPLVTLVSHDFNSKQYTKYPNVIQAVLQAVEHCEPLACSPELLQFAGKSFNAWNISIPMMEKKFTQLVKKSAYGESMERYCNMLTTLYETLQEYDMIDGIWRSYDISRDTKYILSLQQYEKWEESLDVLYELLPNVQNYSINLKNCEQDIWENQYIKSAKNLQQWDQLEEYADNCKILELQLECYWVKKKWDSMKKLIKTHPVGKVQMMKFVNIARELLNNNDHAKKMLEKSNALSLQRWCALPEYICPTHIDLLHRFQQNWELEEAHQFLVNSSKWNSGLIQAWFVHWRNRLPNEWDSINMWNDIFSLRQYFIEKATTLLPKDEYKYKVCKKEFMLIKNTFATIARKHKLTKPSLDTLVELDNIMRNDHIQSFQLSSKRFLQVLHCHINEKQYDLALKVIQNEMPVFRKTHQNEREKIIPYMGTLRLKGSIHQQLGQTEEAQKCFKQAVAWYPTEFLTNANSTKELGKVFVRWAKLYDNLIGEDRTAEDASNNKSLLSMTNSGESVKLHNAEQALVAYLQAIRYYPTKRGSHFMARVLWLLNYTKSTKMADYFRNCVKDIPTYIWLPWIKNLYSLLHLKGEVSKAVLEVIIKTYKDYPQPVYNEIQEFLFSENKVAEKPKEEVKDNMEDDNVETNDNENKEEENKMEDDKEEKEEEKKEDEKDKMEDDDTSQPSTTQQNGISQLVIGQPVIAQPGAAQPVIAQPGVAQPGIAQPGIAQPGVSQPAIAQPSISQPGPQLKPDILEKPAPSSTSAAAALFAQPEITPTTNSSAASLFSSSTTSISEKPRCDKELYNTDHLHDDYKHKFIKLLLRYHREYIRNINMISHELKMKLIPKFEERLLRAIEMVMELCFNAPPSSILPESVVNFSTSVFEKFFNNKDKYMNEIKEQFLGDLVPSNIEELTISEYMTTVLRWQKIIQHRVNFIPEKLPLESLSPRLGQLSTNIEVFGQYQNLAHGEKPFKEQHEKIVCFLMDVDVVKRDKLGCRRISLRSHNGKTFKFVITVAPPSKKAPLLQSELRTWDFLNHINQLFKSNIPAHRRYLQVNRPWINNISSTITLIREKSKVVSNDHATISTSFNHSQNYVSIEDVFHEFCLSQQFNADRIFSDYWNLVGDDLDDDIKRLYAYYQISKRVPEDTLQKFINQRCTAWNSFFEIRKRFTIQYSLYSLMMYLLNVPIRNPSKMFVGTSYGLLYHFDFIPSLKSNGRFSKLNNVPFLLTQNLISFMSPFGIQGSFINSISAATVALDDQKNHFENFVRLLMRDELMNGNNIKEGIFDLEEMEKVETSSQPIGHKPIEIARVNAKEVVERLNNLIVSQSASNSTSSTSKSRIPYNAHIESLINAAQSPENLSKLEPSYMAWF